jgi:hypothetical protein
MFIFKLANIYLENARTSHLVSVVLMLMTVKVR